MVWTGGVTSIILAHGRSDNSKATSVGNLERTLPRVSGRITPPDTSFLFLRRAGEGISHDKFPTMHDALSS